MQQFVCRHSYKYNKNYVAKVTSRVVHDEWIKKFHVRMELITDNKVDEWYISLTKMYYGKEERVDSRSFFFVDRFKNKFLAFQQLSHIIEAIQSGVLK